MKKASLISSTHQALTVAFSLVCSCAYAATEGYITTSTAAGTSEVGPTAVYAGADGAQGGINARESARRTAERDAALQLLEEGRQKYAEGKYSEALEKYQEAWERVPHAPATRNLQEFIRKSISDASIATAMDHAKQGRYDDAEQLLLDVLHREPDNARARKELSYLRDPVRNNPALTPEHVKNVDEVDRLLQLAWGYYDLARYNDAYDTFNSVLRIDPYNEAARRGQEAVSKRRSNFFRAAYDSYRAKALAEVDAVWQEQLPVEDDMNAPVAQGGNTKEQSERQIQINNALDAVPGDWRGSFDETPISDVVAYLRGELGKRGLSSININYNPPSQQAVAAAKSTESGSEDEEGGEDTGDEGGDEEEGDTEKAAPTAVASGPEPEPKVTTRLSGVTLRELLTTICKNSGCVFNITDSGIDVYKQNDPASKIVETRTWRNVPKSFFVQDEGEDSDSGDEEEDAFASNAKGGGSRIDAKKFLKQKQGVKFDAKGADAFYNPRLEQLTVTSTLEDLDTVDNFVYESRNKNTPMVKVTSKFVEVTQMDEDELSFDWVVNPFSVSNNGTTYLGGVTGANATPDRTYQDFVTEPGSGYGNNHSNNGSWPVTNNRNLAADDDRITQGLMTGGLRTGSGATTSSSMDSLLRGGSPAATSTDKAHPSPGILSLSGIYDSGSFQMIMRGLSQKKGVDLVNAPSLVLTPSDEVPAGPEDAMVTSPIEADGDARIEIIRRFIYPSSYDNPEIPTNTNGNNNYNNDNGSSMSVPIAAPANPEEWAVEEVGLVMVVKITDAPQDNIVKFNRFLVRIVDFEGFVNYGSPIVSGVATNSKLEEIVLTENRIDMPVFSRRMINTTLYLYDGHTVAIGGMIEDKVQKVEDKVPVFGDLPLIGRFFRSNAESHTRKNLTIFVTADIIDAAGRPVRNRAAEQPPTGSTSAPGLFPEDGLVTP